jgi:Na+/H+ antiporter NhaD/arsenite permease-like protein
LRRDYVLWALVAVLLGLSVAMPGRIITFPALVHWPTIQTLLGLLILTKGLESCGALLLLSVRIAMHIRNERMLALFLMALSVILAMIMTNDIALFVVVPLTLMLGRIMVLPVRRLVIFEALAVNCGSLLTPIGNPQNIFLWQHSGTHFTTFVGAMLPLFVICAVLLVVFTVLAFRSIPVDMHATRPEAVLNRRLLLISALLYVPFLIMADLRYTALALALIVIVFLLEAPRLLCRIDWPLMIVFVLMFLDLGVLASMPWVVQAIHVLDLHQPLRLFVTSTSLSQGISNVPASILLTGFSSDWRVIAWGVNAGGFGLVIGSLASLIALRIGGQRGSLLAFHAWSIPFFLLCTSAAACWLWLR